MIIKTQLTEADRLKRKIRNLKGKKTKDKTLSLIASIAQTLHKLKELNRFPKTQLSNLERVFDDFSQGLNTTSNEEKLKELLIASDDLSQLLDEMIHSQNQATYEKRLDNVLNFFKNFQSQSYARNISFYDETSDKLEDQLKSVSKDIQYKVSKMQYQRRELVEDLTYLEQTNIDLAKQLKGLNKDRTEYKMHAKDIQDNHARIEMNKGSVELLRKSMNAYQLMVDLFDQLALLDHFNKHLKNDGYIRRLIKRLYRKPNELDVLENSTDLIDVLKRIKDEIIQVESMVEPAQKIVFKEAEEVIDEDLIERYMQMED